MKRPFITLVTDFGLSDHYVAAMKGVMLKICPSVEFIDISHEITSFSVPEGAYTLSQAWQCFPKGTTHLAIVDPGVGSARRAIVAEVAGHRFVAPDNGLFTMVLSAHPRSRIREITATRYFRQPVSKTFHGRDIFAPVAAHLAGGLAPVKVGPIVSDVYLGGFAKPVQSGPGRWAGTVLRIDRFGNIITNFDWPSFNKISNNSFALKIGPQIVSHFFPTYAEVPQGRIFALHGSSGYVEISLNQSDAASVLAARPGTPVELKL